MSNESPLEEKSRTCPSCRTPISVLASKCKFCGEVVGKPKEETRQLSINDLGGESVHHRALSNSVMDALESFRIDDEQAATDGEGYKGIDDFDDSGTSEFDQYDRASMSPAGASGGTPSTGSRIALVVKIVVALVVVGVLAVKVPGYLKTTLDNPSEATVSVYVNRAPGILEANGDTMEALRAAVDATKQDPGPENSKLADEILDMVSEEITALLNSSAWSTDKLKQASKLADEAVEIYATAKSTAVKREVDQENIDYQMFLSKIDPKTKIASFQLNTPGAPQINAGIGGKLIADRFELISISGRLSVKLKDTKRNNRVLECGIAGSPE